VHDSQSVWHLFGNMLMLFIVGYELEEIYGKKLFLGIYLSFMVCSGLVWSAVQQATGSNAEVIGASGAIMGLLVVFVMHFPRRTFLVMGIVPMPAWALAAIYLFFDVVGTIKQQGDVAYVAHLAGAAFGFLFYKTGWSLASLIPSASWWRRVRGPKLRVVHDEESEQTLGQQVDRILEKISREGEASLTKAERKTLEDASRRYQRRKS
jgi:membrane associated rhomboid family serine protease